MFIFLPSQGRRGTFDFTQFDNEQQPTGSGALASMSFNNAAMETDLDNSKGDDDYDLRTKSNENLVFFN